MVERSVLVRLKANVTDYNKAMASAGAATKAFAKDLDSSDSRMTNIIQTSLALGPALVPLGAAVVPTISGITAAMGFAAVGAGTTALAFQGVGDALKAVNDYQLEPTQAHFEKMQVTLAKLGPAGRDFVMFLQKIRPELQKLQDTAQEGMLPGVQEGIEELMRLMPEVQGIIGSVSETLGDMAQRTGADLNGPEWQAFFDYLKTEASPALEQMGTAFGNVITGIANMVRAFDPLNDDFFSGLVHVSEVFRDWSANLGQSAGFQDFVDYVREAGPQAWKTLGALAEALMALVKAAAPVGQDVLKILEVLANTLTIIADSPAGPTIISIAAAVSALSRAMFLYDAVNGSALTTMLDKVRKTGPDAYRGLKTAAAGVSLLALSMTDLDEQVGLSNTASLALIGSFAGPWGAAIGAAIGFSKDFTHANDDMARSIEKAAEAVTSGSVQSMRAAVAELEAQRAKLANPEWYSFKDSLATVSAALAGDGAKSADMIAYLNEQIRDTENAAGGLPSILGSSLGQALGYTSDQFEVAAESAEAFRKGLEGVNALLDKRAAFRDYEQSVDDITERFKARLDILKQIKDLQDKGAADRADIRGQGGQAGADNSRQVAKLQGDLADARAALAAAKTPSARKTAQGRITDIQGQITQQNIDSGRAAAGVSDKIAESWKNQREQVAKLREALADYNVSLDIHGKSGREFQAMLDGEAKAALNVAEKLRGVARLDFLDKARDQFIKDAEAMGMHHGAAGKLATDLGLLDKVKPKPKVTVDIGAAKDNIDSVKQDINSIPDPIDILVRAQAKNATRVIDGIERRLYELDGSVSTVYIRAALTAHTADRLDRVSGGIHSAYGNLIEAYADGGVRESHVAQMAQAGAYRVWAEPETGGESYIPHANDGRRPRAIDIWEQTGKILGVQFQRFATGGTYAASTPAYTAPVAGGGSYSSSVERLAQQLADRPAAPFIGHAEFKHADMRETQRWAKGQRVHQSGGGVNF